jgi:oligosaccharide repeat unit polymerase
MLVTGYPVYGSAVWVILLLVFVLQLGAFIGERLSGRQAVGPPCQDCHDGNPALTSKALRYCIILTVAALAGAIYFVFWSFSRFDLPASPLSFLALGHLWSVQRYEYGELEPWPVRLTIMWVYPAVLLGGISFANAASRRAKVCSLLPFLPTLLISGVEATRAGVFIGSICWISGCLAVRHWQSSGRYRLLRRELFVRIIVLAVSATLLFVLVDAIRQFEGGTFEVAVDLQRSLKYAFGSIVAFSTWYHKYVPDKVTLGSYTFAGIFDSLGIQHREVGLFQDLITLPGGEETNAYTALRGLIQDFTLGGAIFVAFVLGAIGGVFSSVPSRRGWASVLLSSAFYTFVLWSPVTSVFNYNGIVLAWLVAALVLRSHFRSVDRGSDLVRPIAGVHS